MPARQRRSSASRTSSRDGIGEGDVEDEEEHPDRAARPRRRPASFSCVRQVVGLDVERADDAEHDREDAADEDREEVVDPRAAAAQAVEPLDLEGDRHQHADERQHVDVLPERRLPLGHGDQLGEGGLEPEQVGEDEGGRRRAARR